MENEMNPIAETLERLEAATTAFAEALTSLDQRQQTLSGELERISASIEMSQREQELSNRLSEAEAELATLRAASSTTASGNSLRRTLPPVTVELLAKQGIGEGSPVELGTLDAALSGLSLEQRIAVKAQLLRAGSLS
jgi:chromosome segregation ATPase